MNIFNFHFDETKARALRRAINDRQKFSIEREAEKTKEIKEPYNGWLRLCATMTRLENTINHINKMELGKCTNGSIAYDFYEFVNCAYVVIECIRVVIQVFDLDNNIIKGIEESADVFGTKYGREGNDSKFFEYIRSLCGIHPLCTSRRKEYLNGSKFHCCKFVVWTDNGYVQSDNYSRADLIAYVYTTNNNYHLNIGLYIKEFEKYLGKWIDCIPDVIEEKNKYVDKKYDVLRNERVKELSDFDNDVIQYIEYLKEEYIRRVDESQEYILDNYVGIFKTNLSNINNQNKLEKYRNVIMYSLSFFRNSLQNMRFDGFENTGIVYPDKNIETELYIELESPLWTDGEFVKYSYEIEKLYYLSPNSDSHIYDKRHARDLLERPKKMINRYVYFTNEETDEEVYVLIKLALYLEALNRKSIINKNIPNEEQYREKVLSQREMDELSGEEPEEEPDLTKIQEILKAYGG